RAELRPEPIARRRVDELVDAGSFEPHAEGPIVTGFALIDARPVAIAAWEPAATSGIDDVLRLQERVLAAPRPIVYLRDPFSIGRSADDFIGPRAIGRVYASQARLSGHAPQIAIVCGPLWRPAALLPVGCDLVIFAPGGTVSIGDRALVREFTGADLTA